MGPDLPSPYSPGGKSPSNVDSVLLAPLSCAVGRVEPSPLAQPTLLLRPSSRLLALLFREVPLHQGDRLPGKAADVLLLERRLEEAVQAREQRCAARRRG